MNKDLQNLATFMHTLFCKVEHLHVMEEYFNRPDLCRFYLERSIDGTWELPDHADWEKKAKDFVERLDVSSPGEALSLLNRIVQLRQLLEELAEKNPKAKEVFLELLL